MLLGMVVCFTRLDCILEVVKPLRNKFWLLSIVIQWQGNMVLKGQCEELKEIFFWKDMKEDLMRFIRECAIYQQNKNENISPAGLL